MKFKNIKSRKTQEINFLVRPPKDYFWRVLSSLTDDLSQFLEAEEVYQLTSVIRKRDVLGLMSLGEDWGLQGICSGDIDLNRFRARYQLTALLKKVPWDLPNIDRKAAALESFHAADNNCKLFNSQLTSFESDMADPECDPEIRDAFTHSRNFCSKVLGETPSIEEFLRSRHGPGASLDTVSGYVANFYKFSGWPYSVTRRARRLAIRVITSDPRWFGALEDDFRKKFDIGYTSILDWNFFWKAVFRIVDSNRITTVPKSYKTDRTIAIEPTLNLYMQLGVDGFIRRRLKLWDIDLDSQEKNQRLARIGSISGAFATLDMKAASDSISLGICKLLLPSTWYELLIDLRSPYGEFEGEKFYYNKISSMGNGYTFALESLIFSSAIYGVLRALNSHFQLEDCAIFGDDLIVPKKVADLLVRVLERFGFTLNLDKSFFKGDIRESCGADWFSGRLVRPVFIKQFPTHVTHIFNDFNRLKRVLHLYYNIEEKDSKCLNFISQYIPPYFKDMVGPISDESFDQYRHSENFRLGKYSNGRWKIRRVVKTASKRDPKDLNFRKLSHSLSSCLHIKNFLTDVDTQSSRGSRFDVSQRNAVRYSITNSTVTEWQQEYTYSPTRHSFLCSVED